MILIIITLKILCKTQFAVLNVKISSSIMTIVEICLIIIASILVIRSLIELGIVISIARKIIPILNKTKEITDNIKEISNSVKSGANYVKDTIHTFSDDAIGKLDYLKINLHKVSKNLFVINSFLKAIVGSLGYFFKKDDKEK
ncbi:MAG: hypothetical protein OEV44_07975 [Spirochaetota bacterium]|nr:hypothetical protein [Spirochaetota bacterium]